MNVANDILSDITVHMKYARYLHELERRENWTELVTRNMEMHIKKFPNLKKEIIEYCRSKIAHYKCPKSVDFVSSLPRSETGKLLKRYI